MEQGETQGTSGETIAMRAARYFGWHDKPRTGIRVDGNDGYLMIAAIADRTLLAHYNEAIRPTGDFIKLTPKQREALVGALTAGTDRA